MPRDERKGKKRLNESEVASSEMEANLKAIEEDAKRAESERLRTLAQPQPQQQPKQQSSISEEDRKRIRESEIEQTKKLNRNGQNNWNRFRNNQFMCFCNGG